MASGQISKLASICWKCSGVFLKNASVLSTRTLSTSNTFYTGFARRLAIGELNMDWICPYTTLDSEDELHELNQLSDSVAKFFSEKVDSAKMDRNAQFEPGVVEGLKELGAFGLQIPAEYGGLGLSNVKYARVLEEVSTDGAITVMLAAHQAIGLKGILLAGNDEQKKKYLPRLATGEWVAAFCLTEPSSGSDAASIQSRAHLSDDGKHWILNGQKIWITNGGFADVMTVFARTELKGSDGKMVEKVTAFIVERSFGGVTSGSPEDKLGIRASNTCSVTFENTTIPVENVLGDPGEGFKLAMSILNSGRFSMGSSVAGQLRRMITMVTEHVDSRVQFGKKLSEFGLIQDKVFEMTQKIYAMESMAYMTAGQMDMTDDDGLPQDCSIEAAMVKIFSSEAAFSSATETIQIFGGMGYMKDLPFERILRDSRILLIFEGTNEILRLFVALSMLQYAGVHYKKRLQTLKSGHIGERMRLLRHMIREWWTKNYDYTLTPTASFGLAGPSATKTWLHPSMLKLGEILEQSAGVFGKRVFTNLTFHGNEIQHKQVILKTIADVAINLYAMSAVIARCNKAKVLDLRNCDHEFMIAKAFVWNTYRVNSLMMQKLMEPFPFDDSAEREAVCREIMAEGRYICDHPLEVVHTYKENPKYLEQFEKVKKLAR